MIKNDHFLIIYLLYYTVRIYKFQLRMKYFFRDYEQMRREIFYKCDKNVKFWKSPYGNI